MDLKDKIKVMQAFESGSDIEIKHYKHDDWCWIPNPCWDWNGYEYRIKEKKLKPCPFCDGELHTEEFDDDYDLICENERCLFYHGLYIGTELEQIMKQWSE